MEIVFATFESELSAEEVQQTMCQRAENFRVVEGLVQKYFVHDEDNGRYGPVSSSTPRSRATRTSRPTSVPASVRPARLNGTPDVAKAHFLFPLREAEGMPAPA